MKDAEGETVSLIETSDRDNFAEHSAAFTLHSGLTHHLVHQVLCTQVKTGICKCNARPHTCGFTAALDPVRLVVSKAADVVTLSPGPCTVCVPAGVFVN